MATLTLREQLEAKAAYDAALRDELAARRSAITDYDDEFGHTPFAKLYKRRRALLRPHYWPFLHEALDLDKAWIRSPMTWRARGHALRSVLWSLVTHLHCRYAVAPFWLGEWMRQGDDASLTFRHAFSRVGQGWSYYDVGRAGMLGVPLSRRECHALSVMRRATNLVHAVRCAQVAVQGGPRWLGAALRGTPWGRWFGHPERETQRARALAWLCRQPDLDPDLVPPLVAFLDHRPPSRLAGRTVASVLRLAAEAEPPRPARPARVAADEPSRILRWPSSGLQPLVASTARKKCPRWSLLELCSTDELEREGHALDHCVGTYDDDAAAGSCSIWSLRAGTARILTVEVRGQVIVEVRGRSNRLPLPAELAIVRKWATLNELALAL